MYILFSKLIIVARLEFYCFTVKLILSHTKKNITVRLGMKTVAVDDSQMAVG